LRVLAKIVRVGDLTSSITSAFSEEHGWRHWNRAVDMAEELMSVKHRHNLCLLEEEVVLGEPNGNGIPMGRPNSMTSHIT
jgi:hypothetical protein